MDTEPRITLGIDGNVVYCKGDDGSLIWATPISAIVLIAEYTTSAGPWIDDYFLNFWSCEDGGLLKSSATFYAKGRDVAFQILSDKLGSKLQLGLCNATWWTSRVIWPPALQNHVYFDLRVSETKSWIERLKQFCWGPTQEYSLSEEVRSFLQKHEPDADRVDP